MGKSHWCETCHQLYKISELKNCPVCGNKLHVVKENNSGHIDLTKYKWHKGR